MCCKKRYEQCLFRANEEVLNLMHLAGLFYPETALPDKHIDFEWDNFVSACDNAIDALQKLNKLNTNKTYSVEHLAEKIYDELEEKWYFIFNTQVIIGSIKRKKEELLGLRQDEDYDLSPYAGYFLALEDILIDVSEFLISFANWKQIDTNLWAKAFMRKRVSAFEVFSSGRAISRRNVYINDFSVPPLAIFQLRQAIELKVCEILNVRVIVDDKDNIVKVTGEKFLPLLNEDNFIMPAKKSILLKIHKWANAYVHLGYIDDYWKIEFAQFYLTQFFAITSIVFALESYYNEELKRDISNIVKGNNKIIPLRKQASNVELLDAENFNNIKKEVEKIGFNNYIEQREQRFFEELQRRVEQNQS